MNLKNKVVIITGASKGLGKELSMILDQECCRLVLCARGRTALDALDRQISSPHICLTADVRKDMKTVYDKAIGRFGKIDIIINNAGMNFKKGFQEYSEDEIQQVFEVNTMAVIRSARLASSYCPTATFVIISSVAGWFSARNYSIYSATKHAIQGFAKGAKKESKLRFLIFNPYRLRTEFHKNYQIKSPESHMLNPKWYAQYVISSLKGDILGALFYKARNNIFWLTRSLFS